MQVNKIVSGNQKKRVVQQLLLWLLLFGMVQSSYAYHNKNRVDSSAGTAAAGKLTHTAIGAKYGDLSFQHLAAEFAPVPAIQSIRDSARNLLNAISDAHAWVDSISTNALIRAPFGLIKELGGTTYQVGFSNIVFGPSGGTARVFARVITPQLNENGDNKELYFSGNVNLTRTGGIISGNKLALAGEEAVRSCNRWSLVLHGAATTALADIDKLTWFGFNCGGFTSLGLNGEVVLSKDYYQPVSAGTVLTDSSVRINAPFVKTVTSWGSLMIADLVFTQQFVIKTANKYRFEITAATLDFTDEVNPVPEEEDGDFDDYVDDAVPKNTETWRGLYISKLKVGLPNQFRPKGAKEGVTMECEYAVLDETGFTTEVALDNVLSIEEGSADKWPISVDKFSFTIDADEITGGKLEGAIVLPIQDKKKAVENQKAKETADKKVLAAVKAAAAAARVAAALAKANDTTAAKDTATTKATSASTAAATTTTKTATTTASTKDTATAKTTTTTSAAKDTATAKAAADSASDKAIAFTGTIKPGDSYELELAYSENIRIKVPVWKSVLEIDTSSSIQLTVDSAGFHPKVTLSGSLQFNVSGDKTEEVAAADTAKKKTFSCKGISFEELTLQTKKAPYIEIKALGVEGALHIASFEAEYSVAFTTAKQKEMESVPGDMVALKIAADVKLMDGKIAGKTALTFYGLYDEEQATWSYYDYRIGEIAIQADFGKAAFEGSLTLLRNDPVYGNGFAGSLSLRVNQFKVSASGIFGIAVNQATQQPFRYWSVDAQVSGLKLVTGAIVFTGFSGGASYKMNQAAVASTRMPSGITYIPDDQAFLRVRAGVLFDVTSAKAMTATAGLEIIFNKNWGVTSAIITGTARVMSNGILSDSKSALKEGLTGVVAGQSTPAKQDGAIWGKLVITLDLVNDIYQGTLDAYANFNETVVGGLANYRAGTANFYISAKKWYINIGTNAAPVMLNINQAPLYATGTAYFMMGNDIQAGGSTGFGVKHGFAFTTEVGYDVGWLFARVNGGVQYDFILFKNDNFSCNGSPAGLNGWYGSARVQAWLRAAVGVRFWSAEFNVLNANILADMEVRGPKPLYFYGLVKGYYEVGWGWFSKSGDFSVDVKKGTYCAF